MQKLFVARLPGALSWNHIGVVCAITMCFLIFFGYAELDLNNISLVIAKSLLSNIQVATIFINLKLIHFVIH